MLSHLASYLHCSLQVLHDTEVVMEGKIKPYFVENKDKEPQVLENR